MLYAWFLVIATLSSTIHQTCLFFDTRGIESLRAHRAYAMKKNKTKEKLPSVSAVISSPAILDKKRKGRKKATAQEWLYCEGLVESGARFAISKPPRMQLRQ